MSWGKHRGILFVVVVCQFISALSALGIPPFFSLIFRSNSLFAGALFIIPNFFSAISSPFWGSLADRLGKKKLLLRAQIGLSFSFLVASFCQSIQTFCFALILQGILGGTFAASRAYLADFLEGEELSHGLNWMEAAPRAALVISPLVMGLLINAQTPLLIYRYLSILPLITVILTIRLPERRHATQASHTHQKPTLSQTFEFSPHLLLVVQFCFGLASTLASPYFTHSIQNRFLELTPGQLGLLFGLPHLIYLAASLPLSRILKQNRSIELLASAFLFQAVTLIGQFSARSLIPLIIWRLLMGIFMTISFICLHRLISNASKPTEAGGLFGWLEGAVKMSSVAGGLLASLFFQYWGSNSLFFFSAAFFFSTAFFLAFRTWVISKESTA
jgi:MFS family permease